MIDIVVRKFIKWSRRERISIEKSMALVIGGIIFVFMLPLMLILGGYFLDSLLDFPNLFVEPVNLVLGSLLVIIDWSFAVWSVYFQFKIGKGVPLPIVPTRKLVISGPYKYCRNPMVFGTLLFYIGLAVIFNVTSMLFILIPVVFISILIFVKLIEEKKLEIRFGQEYIEYKEKTPFLIPHPKRKQ